jgi:hypothetical protein
MVFIHPVILRDTKSSFEATRDRYEYMQENQQRFRSRLDKFFIPGQSPQLKNMDDLAMPATERQQN